MTKNYKCSFFEFSEEDVVDAMKSMEGYIDITTGTFREIYELAYQHAVKRMLGTMPVKNIMTAPVHCVSDDTDVADAARFLAERRVSGAPVTDREGKVSGVISEKDFLRKMGFDIQPSFMGVISRCLNTSGCMVSGLKNISLSDLVSSPAVTVLEDVSVSEVSSIFIEKSINRLPVCDKNGFPVGIVTRSDLVNAICLQG
ncbi:MAG: CBS domain-containing protein [Desulfobacteraceae bacterium]|nr:CBS domain-containing protein [Desulfobacteraceae bacterium]